MAGREELDARQDIEARLNELEEDEEDDYLDLAEADFGGYDFFSDDYYDRDDYFDFIITRYDNERDF